MRKSPLSILLAGIVVLSAVDGVERTFLIRRGALKQRACPMT
jgi:hypothetical protein